MALFSLNGISKYKKPRPKKANLPILPSDLAILKQLDKEKESKIAKQSLSEPLDYLSPLVDYNPLPEPSSIRKVTDISVVIEAILRARWSDYPKDSNSQYTLKSNVLASTKHFRDHVPLAISINQLYGVFPTTTTKVDQNLNKSAAEGVVRIISVNMFDTSDLVLLSSEFNTMLDIHALPNLKKLCLSEPEARYFTDSQLENAEVEVEEAISAGFLVQHIDHLNAKQLTIPDQGRLLKFMRECQELVKKIIVQNNKKFKEIPEYVLVDKFVNNKKYWTHFNGISIESVLYDCIGAGVVDGFNTPIGRGWKLLK